MADGVSEAANGDAVGRDHASEVERDVLRQPRHVENGGHDIAAQFVFLDDAQRRYQHAFLIDFRDLGAAQTADVELMATDADPGDQGPLVKDRRGDAEIVLMEGAFIGVVDQKHVAGPDARIRMTVDDNVLDHLGD